MKPNPFGIDLLKPVRYKNPQACEEGLVFMIVNYNEVTNRCYIQCQTMFEEWTIKPEWLADLDDLENVPDES